MPGKLINPPSIDPVESPPPDSGQEQGQFSLDHLLAPERVACNVTARSKKHCLEIVSRLLTNEQDSLTYAEVFDTIYQRERLGSTCLGEGFALPHGRVQDLDKSIGAVLKLSEPIEFDVDSDGVDLIFALVVPQDSASEHLNDLSSIARLLATTNVREHVADIRSSRDLYDAIIGLSEKVGLTPASDSPGD